MKNPSQSLKKSPSPSRRKPRKKRRTASVTTQILARRFLKSKLKLNTPFDYIVVSSELKRVLKAKEKTKKDEEKKKAQADAPKKEGKTKAKVEEEVDPSKYTDNRKKFI